jgi:hypothetical protein
VSEEHLAIKGRSSDPVTLVSVTHNHGANALAHDQTLTFGPNLTVVYGQNTAGKSGYTRILKRACRSRFTEDILGDVLSGAAPVKAQRRFAIARVSVKRSSSGDRTYPLRCRSLP